MKRGIFFYVLIALAVLALAGLIWALAPGKTPETPAVVLSLPPAPDSSAAPSAEDPARDAVIDITTETVQTAISTLRRAEGYSRRLTVQSFWTGGSSTTEIDAHIRGEDVRLTVREGGAPGGAEVKHILIKGGEAWIWYEGEAGVWHGSAKDGDADAYQTLLTYEDVLSLDGSAILDAGYTVWQGENCLFVRYTAGELGYEHLCYISDATGLLMGTETYDGNVLIYAMRSSAPELESPDAALFEAPV